MKKRAALALMLVATTLIMAGCGSSLDELTGRAGDGRSGGVASTETTQTAPTVAGTTSQAEDVPVWVTTIPRLAVPGDRVKMTGQGFQGGETVTVGLVDSAGQQAGGTVAVTADLRGGLPATTLQLPTQLAPGEYTVRAQGGQSTREGKAVLWVQAARPAIQLSRDATRPQEQVTITATGFVPRERVVFYFEGNAGDPITALAADGQGNVRAENVVVPILPPGDKQLIAIGSASMAQASEAFRILPFDPVVVLNADSVPAGEAVGFFGTGFAARDQIDISLEGSNQVPLSVRSNDKGQLSAPEAFKLSPDMKGAQVFVLRGQQSTKTVRVSVQVIASYPYVELSSYFGKPGSEVTIMVRNLRPRERLEVFVGEGGQKKKLASFRADDNGWLPKDSRFRLPQDVPPGQLTLALEGEAARAPLRVRFTVTQ